MTSAAESPVVWLLAPPLGLCAQISSSQHFIALWMSLCTSHWGVGVGGSRALDASAESSVSLRQHTRFARSPLPTPPDLPPGSRRSHLVRTSLAPPVLPGSSSRPPVHSSRCVQRALLQRRLSLPHFNPSQPPTTPAWVTTTFL